MVGHGGEAIAPKVSATGLDEWCQDHAKKVVPVDSITKSDRTETELHERVYLFHVMTAVSLEDRFESQRCRSPGYITEGRDSRRVSVSMTL